jgi:hypothetical protein
VSALGEELLGEQVKSTPPRGPVYAETSTITVTGDEAAFVLPPGATLKDIDELLRERGMDPAEWHVERVTVNTWEAHAGIINGKPQKMDLHQLKVFLRNLRGAIVPAVEVERRYRPRPGSRTPPKRKPRITAVFSDQHAPYHDKALHQKVLDWLSTVQPYEFIVAGDTGDYPDISRHRPKKKYHASLKEVGQGSYQILSDYVDASSKSHRRFMKGNHDERLETFIIDHAPQMADLRPADRGDGVEQIPLLSMRNLLHLDALGYVMESEEGVTWEMGEAEIVPNLYVRHQPPTQKNFPRLGGSFITAHTHRQGIEMIRVRVGGRWVTFTITHNGCLCEIDDGMGYALDADWQQGFSTATVWPDGSVTHDLATYRDGKLTWRGERW